MFLQIEVVLGIFIGAVTFTGSVIAFGKLAGKVDGKPKQLPGGHMLNAGAAALSLLLAIMYLNGAGFWTLLVIAALAFFIGYHLIMGGGGDWFHALQRPAYCDRCAGGLFRCDSLLHYV